MLARDEPDRQVADVDPIGRVVLEDAVGVVEEVRPLADRDRQGIEPRLATRRQQNRHVGGCDALPRQEVAQRDEVDVMVRMHVADHDRVQLARIADAHQLADDALAAVDQDGGRVRLDQESRRWGLGLRL